MLFRISRWALPGLIVFLAACGGDSDRRDNTDLKPEKPPPEVPKGPSALLIGEENADSLLGEILFVHDFLSLTVVLDLNTYIFFAPITSCDNGGQVQREHEPDGDHRVTAIHYDDCLVDLGTGITMTLDGDLAIRYNNADPTSPYRVEASGFQYRMEETRAGVVHGNLIGVDGDFGIVPDPATMVFGSVEKANMTLSLVYDEDGGESEHGWQWRLEDYTVPFAVDLATGGRSVGGSGRLELTGADQPQGYVDVSAQLATSTAACPDSGDLSAAGADASRVQLSVQHADEFVLTLNGNADLIDCDALIALYEPMSGPLIAH